MSYPAESGAPVGQKELPFVLGILADLSGHSEMPHPSLLDRSFVEIDIDNFDSVLAQIAPRLQFSMAADPGQPGMDAQMDVSLQFRSLDDFLPEAIAMQVPALAEMLERRRSLNQLAELLRGSDRSALAIEQALSAQNEAGALNVLEEAISRALVWPAHRDEEQRRRTVGLFAAELLAGRSPSRSDPETIVDERIRALDDRLSASVNGILHEASFQALEATWRGLYYLVSQSETGSNLKLRVLNITRKQLRRDFLRSSSFDTSILFKKVHDDIYGSSTGQPFAAFVADFAFGPQHEDVAMLSVLASIGAAINAPFFAAASPEMLNLDNFTDPKNPRGFSQAFDGAFHAPWRRFRESEDSRYVALALPRILLRLPYGRTGQLVESFDFEERIFSNGRHFYLWGNAAYAFGSRVTDAFSRFGWCAAISGVDGGIVTGLPMHVADSSDEGTTGPVEVAFGERQEFELATLGFLPLSWIRGTSDGVFFSAQSCHKSKEPAEASGTATARIAGRLDYLLCASWFAHYLRCLYRDGFVDDPSPAGWEMVFNRWISQYVPADESADSAAKARRPLREARVELKEGVGKPGGYAAVFNFHPHFQLHDPPFAYRMIAPLPHIERRR